MYVGTQAGFRYFDVIQASALLPAVQGIMKRIHVHKGSEHAHYIVLSFETKRILASAFLGAQFIHPLKEQRSC